MGIIYIQRKSVVMSLYHPDSLSGQSRDAQNSDGCEQIHSVCLHVCKSVRSLHCSFVKKKILFAKV